MHAKTPFAPMFLASALRHRPIPALPTAAEARRQVVPSCDGLAEEICASLARAKTCANRDYVWRTARYRLPAGIELTGMMRYAMHCAIAKHTAAVDPQWTVSVEPTETGRMVWVVMAAPRIGPAPTHHTPQ